MSKASDLGSEAAEIRRRLKEMGNPKAASLAKSALRSPLSFHGVIPPQVRSLAREIARRHRKDRTLAPLLTVARALWKSRWHEERSTAIHMVATLIRRLEHEHWNEFKDWLKDVRSADHCDGIAVELLGSLVKRDRTWCRVLKHWTLSASVWDRRAAAMGVLLRTRQMGDVDAAFYVCESLMQDRSAAVREGVMIVLSEARLSDADATRDFLTRWKVRGSAEILKALSS
ncbi:MAG TPA: DNA alkylation repair protein [Planctomycetota bacterium]|nr:DNA alkylation repair protein [Planctomycetota bacterium]